MPIDGTIQTAPAGTAGLKSISAPGYFDWGTAEPSEFEQPKSWGTISGGDTGYSSISKLNDPTGKYIGAVINPTAKEKARSVMNQTEPAKAFYEVIGSDGSKTAGESKVMDTAKGAAEAASGVADRIFTASQNVAQNQRRDDMIRWKEEGKYWFDPNADLKPDLEKYLSQMPSATDALVEGSPIAQLGTSKNGAVRYAGSVINPASFNVKNKAVSSILNPTNLADRAMGEGYANYVGSKAAQGALSSGGVGPQMIVGGIVGMIEGMLGWSSAKKEDAKNKKLALEEYERSLRDWTINKNKRMIAAKEAKYIEAQTAKDTAKAIQQTDAAKRALNIAARRKQIADVLSSAGSISGANRQARLARWK